MIGIVVVEKGKQMDDLISKQDAYDTLTEYYHHRTQTQHDALRDALSRVPSIQAELCDGCQWENAFGYGECYHCKRKMDDMYKGAR